VVRLSATISLDVYIESTDVHVQTAIEKPVFDSRLSQVFLFCPVFPVLLGMKEKGVLSADDYADLEKHCAFLQG